MSKRPDNVLPLSHELRAFLQAIKDSPDEEGPRFIFADWLDEHGDPRGKLMRAQCQLEAPQENDPQRHELQQEVSSALQTLSPWLDDRPIWRGDWKSHRGLLTFWVNVHLDFENRWQALLEHEWWPWVDYLHVYARTIDSVMTLVESPQLSNLNSLNLWNNPVNVATAKALAQSPHVRNLISLKLSRTSVGNAGVEALAVSPSLGNLRRLELSYAILGTAGIEALAESKVLTDLRILNLSYNHVGDDGIESFASSPIVKELRVLDLSGAQLGDQGAVALASTPSLSNLQVLHLQHNEIGDRGAEAIAQSPYLRNLTRLYLGNNPNLANAGAMALAGSPLLRNLTLLNLTDTPITEEGWQAFEHSPYLTNPHVVWGANWHFYQGSRDPSEGA